MNGYWWRIIVGATDKPASKRTQQNSAGEQPGLKLHGSHDTPLASQDQYQMAKKTARAGRIIDDQFLFYGKDHSGNKQEAWIFSSGGTLPANGNDRPDGPSLQLQQYRPTGVVRVSCWPRPNRHSSAGRLSAGQLTCMRGVAQRQQAVDPGLSFSALFVTRT